MHAEHYALPQARARVFIIGLRSDLQLKPLSLPKPDEKNLGHGRSGAGGSSPNT